MREFLSVSFPAPCLLKPPKPVIEPVNVVLAPSEPTNMKLPSEESAPDPMSDPAPNELAPTTATLAPAAMLQVLVTVSCFPPSSVSVAPSGPEAETSNPAAPVMYIPPLPVQWNSDGLPEVISVSHEMLPAERLMALPAVFH